MTHRMAHLAGVDGDVPDVEADRALEGPPELLLGVHPGGGWSGGCAGGCAEG